MANILKLKMTDISKLELLQGPVGYHGRKWFVIIIQLWVELQRSAEAIDVVRGISTVIVF